MEDSSLVVVPAGPGRDELIDLLLLADDSPEQVAAYLHEGDLFVLRDGAGTALALSLVLYRDEGTAELKAVAVRPERQGQGVGKGMLAEVLARLRAAGVRRVLVSTGASSLGPLALYQKLGFRPFRIERDAFTPERGYPEDIVEHGIRLRDMIWLDLDLDLDPDPDPGAQVRRDARRHRRQTEGAGSAINPRSSGDGRGVEGIISRESSDERGSGGADGVAGADGSGG